MGIDAERGVKQQQCRTSLLKMKYMLYLQSNKKASSIPAFTHIRFIGQFLPFFYLYPANFLFAGYKIMSANSA